MLGATDASTRIISIISSPASAAKVIFRRGEGRLFQLRRWLSGSQYL